MVHALTMAFCLVNLAVDYRQLEAEAEKAAVARNYAEAQVLYTSALVAAKISAGHEHPDVAHLLTRVALMMELLGDATGPEPLYQEAIKMLDTDPLASSAELASALELYSGFLAKHDRTVDAMRLRERASVLRMRLVEELAAQHPVPSDATPGFLIGAVDSAPVPISRIEHQYSSIAMVARWQGSVLLTVEVGVDGVVRAPTLRRSLGLGLDEKATETVLQWKFRPGMKGGEPVPVKANVEIHFRLL